MAGAISVSVMVDIVIYSSFSIHYDILPFPSTILNIADFSQLVAVSNTQLSALNLLFLSARPPRCSDRTVAGSWDQTRTLLPQSRYSEL